MARKVGEEGWKKIKCVRTRSSSCGCVGYCGQALLTSGDCGRAKAGGFSVTWCGWSTWRQMVVSTELMIESVSRSSPNSLRRLRRLEIISDVHGASALPRRRALGRACATEASHTNPDRDPRQAAVQGTDRSYPTCRPVLLHTSPRCCALQFPTLVTLLPRESLHSRRVPIAPLKRLRPPTAALLRLIPRSLLDDVTVAAAAT